MLALVFQCFSTFLCWQHKEQPKQPGSASSLFEERAIPPSFCQPKAPLYLLAASCSFNRDTAGCSVVSSNQLAVFGDVYGYFAALSLL
jgi:hypothetical protein